MYKGVLPGVIAVHDSHDPHRPALICVRHELARFLAAAKDGAFDGRHR